MLDFYGNISSPVTDTQQRLLTLRRLETIGGNGIPSLFTTEGHTQPLSGMIQKRASVQVLATLR